MTTKAKNATTTTTNKKGAGQSLGADSQGQIAALAKLSSTELQKRYEEVFGTRATSCNVMHLRGAIARALLERAGQLAPDASTTRAAAAAPPAPPPRDGRLPAVGSVLRREHEGVVHRVKVLQRGFVYQGAQYRSLSSIAKAITGTTWNGFLWFGLVERAPRKKAA
ncbi:MAG: DUF2924 domain-containing protein [Deltaproteobacteria bacterium]|nr:DUF2924 domain-containing protein [Deltaproteobacteria bacterium]